MVGIGTKARNCVNLLANLSSDQLLRVTDTIIEVIAIQCRLTFNLGAVVRVPASLLRRGLILRVHGSREILNASFVRRILEARVWLYRAEIDSSFKTALNTY